METFQTIVLSLSGLALFYASSMRLINPKKAVFLQTYLSNPRNKLITNTDLVNEIRGVGAVMLLGGIVILSSMIMPNLRFTSFVLAIVIFFGVASGRLISFGLDGRPTDDIIKVAIIEMILSVLNVFCLISIQA